MVPVWRRVCCAHSLVREPGRAASWCARYGCVNRPLVGTARGGPHSGGSRSCSSVGGAHLERPAMSRGVLGEVATAGKATARPRAWAAEAAHEMQPNGRRWRLALEGQPPPSALQQRECVAHQRDLGRRGPVDGHEQHAPPARLDGGQQLLVPSAGSHGTDGSLWECTAEASASGAARREHRRDQRGVGRELDGCGLRPRSRAMQPLQHVL